MRRGVMITAVTAALMIWAVPEASASTGWVIQPTPIPTGAVGGGLAAVSCPSATSCTAVGNTGELPSGVTLAEHWDGSTWAIQDTPNPPGAYDSVLTGVSCSSAASCTAVGYYQPAANADSLPFAEHWDGSTWTVQTMPSPPGGSDVLLRAVSCPSATSCTAVGDYLTSASEPTLAEYWDGSTWTIQTMPSPEPASHSGFLYGVSCTAPDKCTAVGSFAQGGKDYWKQLIEQHYGSRWRKISPHSGSSMPGQAQAVSCTARNSCTVVGQEGLAERWDGTGWTVQATPKPAYVSLNAVSCTSATSCTAAGVAYNIKGWGTVAERYYQGTWHRQATASPVAGKEFLGVSCTSASTCTAAGEHTGDSGPLAEHN